MMLSDVFRGSLLNHVKGTYLLHLRCLVAAAWQLKQQLSEAVVVPAETRHRLRRQRALPLLANRIRR